MESRKVAQRAKELHRFRVRWWLAGCLVWPGPPHVQWSRNGFFPVHPKPWESALQWLIALILQCATSCLSHLTVQICGFNGQITVHAFKISIVKSMTMTMSMTKTFMKIPWDKGTSKPLKRQNICQSVLNIISQQFFEYYRYWRNVNIIII